MNEILAFNAALALAEQLIPVIAEGVRTGTITKEQQAQARERYDALRAKGKAAFTGPEWEVETK